MLERHVRLFIIQVGYETKTEQTGQRPRRHDRQLPAHMLYSSHGLRIYYTHFVYMHLYDTDFYWAHSMGLAVPSVTSCRRRRRRRRCCCGHRCAGGVRQ